MEGVVEPIQKGVLDRPGKLPMYTVANDPPFASLFSRSDLTPTREFAETIALDDALGDITPSVIKIDVEGSEFLALQGMTKILARANKLVMFVENSDIALRSSGSSSTALVELIQGLGFQVRGIDEHKRQVTDSLESAYNLYCTRILSASD